MKDSGTTRATTLPMRVLLFTAAILVLIIGLPLYVAPRQTELLFSWTVNPPITAAFLGGAYLGAFVIEFLSSRERVWSSARIAVPAVFLFTTMTLVATLLHIEKFHFGPGIAVLTRFITWTWLVVYAVVPVAIAAVFLFQMRADARTTGPSAKPLALTARFAFALEGAPLMALGAAFFAAPDATKHLWPWALSPLTARAIGAWLLGIGLLLLHTGWEGDIRRARNAAIAVTLSCLLEFGALARLAFDTDAAGMPVIDWGGPAIWILVASLAAIAATSGYVWNAARPGDGAGDGTRR